MSDLEAEATKQIEDLRRFCDKLMREKAPFWLALQKGERMPVSDAFVGQVWEDMDPRTPKGPKGERRRLRIVRLLLGGRMAEVEIQGFQVGSRLPAKPRPGKIAVRRLKPGARGYALVEP